LCTLTEPLGEGNQVGPATEPPGEGNQVGPVAEPPEGHAIGSTIDDGRVPIPAWLVEDARRFAESGTQAAMPRRAATVVLLRPSTVVGFEVYMQRRPATMAFAPNMYVFPGGTVDTRDGEANVEWVGPGPQWWATRMGLSTAEARAVVCAAVRELFEESGVLLAGAPESTVASDVSGGDWEAARLALLAREVSLGELLAERGLAVRSDLLAPWGRWLTPEFEQRRYDTFFFLAHLPTDQRTRDVGGETEHTMWLAPAEASRLPMLPPTSFTLRQLSEYHDIRSALAAAADRILTVAVTPRIHVDLDGEWLVLG
jgi:8-oxo-dGTP pyrophosphatase MutT (NUDIX family)